MVAQLQIALVVEELWNLRDGFVTFDFSNCFLKTDIIVLLNAVCIERWRRVTQLNNSHSTLSFISALAFKLYTALPK